MQCKASYFLACVVLSFPYLAQSMSYGELAGVSVPQAQYSWNMSPNGYDQNQGNHKYQHVRPEMSAWRYGYPGQNVQYWSYIQAGRMDNPYTWRTLDGLGTRMPWGQPMASWTSMEMWNWWRIRSGAQVYRPYL